MTAQERPRRIQIFFSVPARVWTLLGSLLRFSSKWSNRRRGYILRALLCWSIGCLSLSTDEESGYDARFQIRGPQEASAEIVILNVSTRDLQSLGSQPARFAEPSFNSQREIEDVTDNFYWEPELWKRILSKLLSQNVDKIGVAFHFRSTLGPASSELDLFQDPKVIWTYSVTPQESAQYPLFTNGSRNNIASIELRREEDGVVRKFYKSSIEDLHLIESITGVSTTQKGSRYINFRGGSGRYQELSVQELLSSAEKLNLKGKIVLIGPKASGTNEILTPLGLMSRPLVLANLIDNQLNDRWITRTNNWVYSLGLFFLALVCLLIVTQYPQAVAIFFLVWMATFSLAFSAWIFDSYNFWIPSLSAIVLIVATWVVFTGFQANRMERQNWKLQQEQKYSQEVEQLKNNFVSLISHDLKTPIAKIQAVVDRMILQQRDPSLLMDLNSLRLSSEELNRYIQSILKVLRVESRDFRLQRDICDLNQVIEEAVDQLKTLAQERNINLSLDLEPLFSMEIDHTLIKEVLINLIENALKYTPANGRVTVRSREIENEIIVEVEDTGHGIPKEELQEVWGKFVRGRDQDLKTKGTGLGLYLVKYFIELHGGQVQLRSELKKGTMVSFSLPLETQNAEVGT